MDEAIRKHRMGILVVNAAPGVQVEVEQLTHEFWFGAALANQAFSGGMSSADTERYRRTFLANFNSAVTENALKWLSMERRQGEVDYSVVNAMLEWAEANVIPLRGHNIFWGVPNRVQHWQKAMDDETLEATLENRARDIGRRYRGRFAEYDLNNEMIHANYYEDRLGPEVTLRMCQWVHSEDPEAVLYLNDYDILTGNRLDDYVRQIRDLKAQGAGIGGIGVQGHLHSESFDPSALREALDQLGQFDLPIRVTEFNMPGQRSKFHRDRRARMTEEDELVKARNLVDYYRICFAHPSVDGILMWGFWEGANWIPASSLFRRDWTPTPAAKAYQGLVYEEWWSRETGETDAQGRCEFRLYQGRHRVRVGEEERVVEIRSGEPSLTITVGQGS